MEAVGEVVGSGPELALVSLDVALSNWLVAVHDGEVHGDPQSLQVISSPEVKTPSVSHITFKIVYEVLIRAHEDVPKSCQPQ